ncbi:ArsR/SmtB family transcription factor [Serinicoccus kebangsaanensis]|uniref:ArsR/SmtB family transcription factor n=1 Tax=Serinicoccus kebangsaanensis TaxID=2602069 RepID=UPI00124CD0F4|nr:metalloregulator ArsR/SmtB family transcription factor [Serinicoccus kebangsaanensis]
MSAAPASGRAVEPGPCVRGAERDAAVRAAALFHGLSDPSRVAILRHLLLGEHNVRELTEHLDLAQSTVSGHLACLRGCGLVSARSVGRSTMLSVADPTLVTALLAATEELLSATGDAVVLCPASGPGVRR